MLHVPLLLASTLHRGEAEREGPLLAELVKGVGRTGRQRCANSSPTHQSGNPSILGGCRRVQEGLELRACWKNSSTGHKGQSWPG